MLSPDQKTALASLTPILMARVYEETLMARELARASIADAVTTEEDARQIFSLALHAQGPGKILVVGHFAFRSGPNTKILYRTINDPRPDGLYDEPAGDSPFPEQALALSRETPQAVQDADGVASRA